MTFKGLSKKQRGFVKDYVATENGSQSALKHYDTDKPEVARSIASENLTKPYIIEAISELRKSIADRIPDELLEKRHIELLDKRERIMIDGELEDVGPDVQAVTKGLDMAYKLKGSYAGEKSTTLNLNIDAKNLAKTDIEALRVKYEEELQTKLLKENESNK